jgi:hypothetical protein
MLIFATGIGIFLKIGLDRRHHRYCRGSGSDSLQSANSFTSFINVITLISLLGEEEKGKILFE